MSDSCVELVTFEQLLRRYPQLEQPVVLDVDVLAAGAAGAADLQAGS